MKVQKTPQPVTQHFWWVALIVIGLLAGITVWCFFDYKIEKIKRESYSIQNAEN
ncbi:MAG: hypothetical protein SFV52_02170 [Saprospiraceae bacterium]|nr:hypothetical protein [Saprospiraceae bacterium]